jgi:hypothetical protein
MRLPSGENATEYMRPRWPSTARQALPVAASQRRSVPSWPHDTSVLPSGANAIDVTVFSWRRRRVPIRIRAPFGSGSPSTSTGVFSWRQRQARIERRQLT